MPPNIAIIVPAFNTARFLASALDSILAQTVSAWEVILVDDGSEDDTGAIARRYAARDPRIHVYSQANAGVSAARNFGFAQADPAAEGVIFLDADDVWEPDALETLGQALAAHPEAPAVYGLARYIDATGQPLEPGVCEGHQQHRFGVENGRVIFWPPDRPTDFNVEAVMERVMTPGTVLVRRRALEQSGLFDPSLRLWEDWDLWLRVSQLGGLIFLNTLVLGYRQHEANASGSPEAVEAAEWQVRRKLLESLQDDLEHLVVARLGLEYRQRSAVSHCLSRAKSLLRERRFGPAARQGLAAVRECAALLRLRRAHRRG